MTFMKAHMDYITPYYIVLHMDILHIWTIYHTTLLKISNFFLDFSSHIDEAKKKVFIQNWSPDSATVARPRFINLEGRGKIIYPMRTAEIHFDFIWSSTQPKATGRWRPPARGIESIDSSRNPSSQNLVNGFIFCMVFGCRAPGLLSQPGHNKLSTDMPKHQQWKENGDRETWDKNRPHPPKHYRIMHQNGYVVQMKHIHCLKCSTY